MGGRIVTLSLIVLGLALADRMIAHRAEEARLAGTTAHRLRDAAGGETPRITEVRLADGRGGTVTLSNESDGLWRSPSVLGAPAAVGPLERFVTTLLDCEGFERSARPERAPRYGLDVETTLHVSLHGPGEPGAGGSDLVLAADIGDCLREADQCFVRPAGQQAVWALECDLRSLLVAEPPRELPPLIDPSLVPAQWPGSQAPLRRVVIARAGQGTIELLRHDRERPKEPADFRQAPWTWALLDATGEGLPVHQQLVSSFNSFVLNVPFAGIVPTEEAVELDWERPHGRVVLYPDAGAPLELRLGEAKEWGTPVYNSFARLVYILAPEAAGLLAPSAAQLAPDAAVDPWRTTLERIFQEPQAPVVPATGNP